VIERGESFTAKDTLDACLDRQVWHLLTGRQARLALGGNAAKRIDPRYGPFAALPDQGAEAQRELTALARGSGDELWFVEPGPVSPPRNFRVKRSAVLLQMIADNQPGPDERHDSEAVLLGDEHAEAMTALALATKPGPWGERTACYGPF